jgi:hypothetical protein
MATWEKTTTWRKMKMKWMMMPHINEQCLLPLGKGHSLLLLKLNIGYFSRQINSTFL